MPDGVCKKCGWKAPAGLLKCPFCKTYIREPGSGSSSEKLDSMHGGPHPPVSPLAPGLPAPDPKVVRHVQRELARELFDDSDKWPVFEGGETPPHTNPDDDKASPG